MVQVVVQAVVLEVVLVVVQVVVLAVAPAETMAAYHLAVAILLAPVPAVAILLPLFQTVGHA